MNIEELCNHVNPHIAEALRAAAVATDTGTDEDIAEFQRLCRPAEYILLVRRAVELESGLSPNAGAHLSSERSERK
jgi:hypothetical protein